MSDHLHQELKSHATALRGLARDLLHDHHAAEDVTQQTLAKAWSVRGKLRPGPLGGWLSRTLLNFTRQWQRGERRRTARETELARHRSGEMDHATPAERLARREALQAVTAAVLQLDEPYQTTVFLRYFEDLPPRAIARRTESSVATVKSRLTRGLATLRHCLARSHGANGRDDPDYDWRVGLAFAFGIPIGATLIPVTTGVLLVKTSLKVTLLVAAVCVGGLMLYRGGDVEPPAQQARHAQQTSGVAASKVDGDTEDQPSERTAATLAKIEEPWLTHPYQLELEITVLDTLGLPVQDYTPELAPADGTLRNAADATDAHGKVVVSWAARQPSVTIDVLDPGRHRRRVTLQHGRRTQLTLLRTSQPIKFTVNGSAQVLYISDLSKSGKWMATSSSSDRLEPGLHPHAVFSERGIVVEEPKETKETAADGVWTVNLSGGKFEVFGRMLSTQKGTIDVQTATTESPATNGVIEGIVFGVDGQPASKVTVVLLGSSPQPLQRTETDGQGRFRFEGLTANTFDVRAGGDAAGLTRLSIAVGQGVAQANMQLRRDACIRGTLRDTAGKPVANSKIEWHSDDGTWADGVKTDAHGAFLLANLRSKPGRLIAWGNGEGEQFPVAVEAGVVPDSGELLVTAADRDGCLIVQPAFPDDLDARRVQIRVRQVDTGFSRAIRMPRTRSKTIDADGKERTATLRTPEQPWRLDHLPAGDYEVVVWLAGSGILHLGRHYLDGKTEYDLGSATLRNAGRLQFDLPAGNQPDDFVIEIVALRADFDVRVETLQLGQTVLLAPGDYALACQRPDQAARFTRLSVESGQTTRLPLTW